MAQAIRAYDFNPLPSCEGRHAQDAAGRYKRDISIHSPHARGDDKTLSIWHENVRFQSTPLMRGETYYKGLYQRYTGISIHSPHARGDKFSPPMITPWRYFNPLPSCEGRLWKATIISATLKFQSTPLMRGETKINLFGTWRAKHFNPLPSCEGRRHSVATSLSSLIISIHSPHARGDFSTARHGVAPLFQSTPLMRGETKCLF